MKTFPEDIDMVKDYCYRTDCFDCRFNILNECMLVNENCRTIVIKVIKKLQKQYREGDIR